MTEPAGAAEPTEEELAAVLTALRLRRPTTTPPRELSALAAWRHRRLAALGRSPSRRPPSS